MMKTRFLPLIALLATMIAACSASSGVSPSPTPSASGSQTPSLVPVPSHSPAPSDGSGRGEAITTPDEAAQRVIEVHPEFAGISAQDPDLIGGCCWYEATRVTGGFQVVMNVGWGDCPSGCIDRHRWTFAVSPQGDVGLINEDGPEVPPGVLEG
jgi:hypothetical protein